MMRCAVVVLFLCVQVDSQLLDLLRLFGVEDDQGVDVEGEYDFVVVGAGSAGSVVASRLSENENWRVLLLEAGSDESFLSDIPLMAALQSSTSYNWGYRSSPTNFSCLGLTDARCNLPRGKAVGGTSVINFLIYTRGNKLDFDDWSRLGNAGWSYDEVLPYFIKSENCSTCGPIDKNYHGFDGYLDVQHPPYETPLAKLFLKAGQELNSPITDPNGRTHLGFSKVQATMRNGRRCSTAKAFLNADVRNRPNLQIVIGARVTKILIDDANRAYGVEFLRNKRKYTATVNKEVVLSAGSINTPQLLMLSGVGPSDELSRNKIRLIKDLPVGHNLQDHVALAALIFLVNQSVTVSDEGAQNPGHVFNYLLNGNGPFTLPSGAEALAFLKTKFSERKNDDYPDVEVVLGAGALNGDRLGTLRRLLGIPDSFYRRVCEPIEDVPGFSMTVVLMRPKSRGRIRLKDSNPLHWPVIETNYFEDEDDVEYMVEGIKKTIEISKTKSFQKLGTKLHDVPFPGCEHLHFAGDSYWRCVVRHMATTLGHQVGTCKMGPARDPNAVVDQELKVHGVKGLRVVDGSVMPNLVAGHTNSVIVMIGEKASDMIKNEWK